MPVKVSQMPEVTAPASSDVVAMVTGGTVGGGVITGGTSKRGTVLNLLHNWVLAGADPLGVTDSTAALHALRDAVPTYAKVRVPPGTYRVTGLTLNKAGQVWDFAGATLILANAANTSIITLSANDVTLRRGRFNGNRANQTLSGDRLINNGIKVVGNNGANIVRCDIFDCYDHAILLESANDVLIYRNYITNCHRPNVNAKAIQVYFNTGASTFITIRKNKIDGTPTGTGCVGVAAVGAATHSVIKVTDNELLVGNGSATAEFTLGVELFTASGGTIRDFHVDRNTVIGASASIYTFGISMGGVVTTSTSGVRNGTCNGNTVRGCGGPSIESIGSNISIVGNTITDSGRLFISADEVVGGCNGVIVMGNTIDGAVDTNYAIHLSGGTNGISGIRCGPNTLSRVTGVGVLVAGLVTGRLDGNTIKVVGGGTGGSGIVFNSTAVTPDLSCSFNTLIMTGSASTADGISLVMSATSSAGLRLEGNVIFGAGRDGIHFLTAGNNVRITDNTVHNCFHGIVTDSVVCDKLTLLDNEVYNNTHWGMLLQGAHTLMSYRGNRLYGNTDGNEYTLDNSSWAAPADVVRTATWDAPLVVDGAMTSTTIAVNGAAIGDSVQATLGVAVPAGAILAGNVTAAGTVTVTLFNKSGGSIDLASTTLTVVVRKR